jgi:hypothetical protein
VTAIQSSVRSVKIHGPNPKDGMGLNPHYEIRIKGILDGRWSSWFEGLQVSSYGEETVIAGPIADQAALHGLLTKVRDLGLFLISVYQVDPDRRPDGNSDQDTNRVHKESEK